MKVGFYYHIPVCAIENEIWVPGFLGVFLDSIAENVEQLSLFMHQANESQKVNCDYCIKRKNVVWVNIGFPKPAWHRSFLPSLTLNIIKGKYIDLDFLILRSPTPLATSMFAYFQNVPIIYLIVGDYLEGADNLKSSTFRDRVIYYYLKIYDWQFTKTLRNSKIVVNSPALKLKYAGISSQIGQVITTTIRDIDIFERKPEITNKNSIKILFTGRIDPAKGLFELVNALPLILKKISSVHLNIVGWEDSSSKIVENKLLDLAHELGVQENIHFLGKKKVGEELLEFYREADIYILPSYHEGFPRTIWEAMSQGTPVIASNVGGIPGYLTNNLNCLLISPHSVDEIYQGVIEMVNNDDLRNEVVKNAYRIVSKVTLERQTKNLIEQISQLLKPINK